MFELACWFYSVGAEPTPYAAMPRKPLWCRGIQAPDRLTANETTRRFPGRRGRVCPIRQPLYPSTSDIHP
jgi:hypothetical protein